MSEIPNNPQIRGTQTKGQLLPGVAAIALWMLVIATMGAFAVLKHHVPRQMGLFLVLPFSTLIILGVFGMLSMRRWGWALVLGGTLSVGLWCFYIYGVFHISQTLVMGMLHIVFFFYLVRAQVRERMR
jgi:hypothetical protein